jgi:hypothetical protein
MHARRVYMGIIQVHPVSWTIWTLTAIAIMFSYRSMRTGYAFYITIGNIIFPAINLLLSFRQKTKLELSSWDYAACTLGILSLIYWYLVQHDPENSAYANYIAIFADLCALIPTFLLVRKNPMIEKPLPWIIFSLGFIINIVSLHDHSLSSYILPIYMFIGSNIIAMIQIRFRMKHHIQEPWY